MMSLLEVEKVAVGSIASEVLVAVVALSELLLAECCLVKNSSNSVSVKL